MRIIAVNEFSINLNRKTMIIISITTIDDSIVTVVTFDPKIVHQICSWHQGQYFAQDVMLLFKVVKNESAHYFQKN